MRVLLLLALLVVSAASCSVNILEEFADKESNEALLVEAKIQINKRQWQAAINLFNDMTPAFLAQRDVVVLHASAYGGLCGIDFLSLTDAISNMGTSNLLEVLLAEMKGAGAAAYNACNTAEDLLLSNLPASAARTEDENLLVALISLGKMGSILAEDATLDSDDDGVVETTWGGCSATSESLTVARLQEFAFSTVKAIDAISNQSTIGGVFPSGICSLAPPFDTVCAADDPSDFDATLQPLFRGLIREDSDNLGLNRNSDTPCVGGSPFNSVNCVCN